MEIMARTFLRRGDEVLIRTFTLQYPSLLFPGKSQTVTTPPPGDLHITRCVHTVNPFNWWRVGRQIRRDRPDLADMPIIVISEFGERADVVAGKLAGADDYLAKPLGQAELARVIAAALAARDALRLAQLEGKKEAIQNITDKINERLEAWIREYPEEWFWLHNRWKWTDRLHPELKSESRDE